MTATPATNIYEETFAKSDKTDAILIVKGKKLHVNKALLSCHSDYFNTLFNSEFKEKSMPEIEIKDVKFEDFATLLSLVHHQDPLKPTARNVENLVILANRFLLPAAKRHVELFLMSTNIVSLVKKVEIADKYQLEELLQHSINSFTDISHFKNNYYLTFCGLSNTTQLLSIHSDYFDKLFNGDFSEKTMPEIPIEDVDFKIFAGVLSLILPNPIHPTVEDVEKLLELAEHFELPAAKRYLELFIISTEIPQLRKLILADAYDLSELLERVLAMYRNQNDVLPYNQFRGFSDKTKARIFDRLNDLRKVNIENFSPVVKKAKLTAEPEESPFPQSDKTDAILVVDGEKLHVNKTLLSFHSDYFNALFNSDFKEKSMPEIKIKDARYAEFCMVLSFVHPLPSKPSFYEIKKLLELADRFLLPAAKRHLELSLITVDPFFISTKEKLSLADQFNLDYVLKFELEKCKTYEEDIKLTDSQQFSDRTKVKLFERQLAIYEQSKN